MTDVREVKCDHAIEDSKKHPVAEHVNIGNLIISMCGTCYNALKGQLLDDSIPDLIKAFETIARSQGHINNIIDKLY